MPEATNPWPRAIAIARPTGAGWLAAVYADAYGTGDALHESTTLCSSPWAAEAAALREYREMLSGKVGAA